MISQLYDTTSDTAARCLSLIERHAAKMARVGGGALNRETRFSAPVTIEQQREILALRRSGLVYSEISARTGYSEPTISKFCRGAGMPLKRPRRMSPAQVATMRRLWRSKLSPAKIAAAIGCNVSTIHKRMAA